MTKNKVKLNDKTEKKNNKHLKQDKYVSDDAKEIRRFVIILFNG